MGGYVSIPTTAAACVPRWASNITIPESNSTVKVSILDNGAILNLTSSDFHVPDYQGADRLVMPSYSFLVERESGERFVFDLGIRKDWNNLPPTVLDLMAAQSWTQTTKMNTADLLAENGIDVNGGAVTGVFWSHAHFDHIGDLTTFPNDTKLIVGPGFEQAFLPGYPLDPKSSLHNHDFDGRLLEEMEFRGDLRIGRFAAHDYFGDGSFFLLDTPGHMQGHISALARTSALEPSFVLLGGDVAHHTGELRPSQQLVLPEIIDPSPIPELSYPSCPGHYFQSIQPHHRRDEPFYTITPDFNLDTEDANWSIDGFKELDSDENIWIIISHDAFGLKGVEFFPEGDLGLWKKEGWKKKGLWAFLEAYETAVCLDVC